MADGKPKFDVDAPAFVLSGTQSAEAQAKDEEAKSHFQPEAAEFHPPFNLAAQEFKPPGQTPAVDTHSSVDHSSKAFEGVVRNFAILIGEVLLTFDVHEQKWRTITGITTNVNCVGYRYAAGLFLPADRQLMFCGGREAEGPSDLAWIVDVKRRSGEYIDNSKYIQPLLYPRMLHSLVSYRGIAYVIGGQSDRETYLDSVERWTEDRWEIVDDLKRPRSTFAAVATEVAIYVFGGYSGSGQVEPSIEKFTEESEEWVLLAVDLDMFAGSGVIQKDAGSLLILGGTSAGGASKRVLKLDTETDAVTVEPYELKHSRVRPIVFKANGKIAVLGGSRTDSELFANNEFTQWISAPKLVSSDHLMSMPYLVDPTRQ